MADVDYPDQPVPSVFQVQRWLAKHGAKPAQEKLAYLHDVLRSYATDERATKEHLREIEFLVEAVTLRQAPHAEPKPLKSLSTAVLGGGAIASAATAGAWIVENADNIRKLLKVVYDILSYVSGAGDDAQETAARERERNEFEKLLETIDDRVAYLRQLHSEDWAALGQAFIDREEDLLSEERAQLRQWLRANAEAVEEERQKRLEDARLQEAEALRDEEERQRDPALWEAKMEQARAVATIVVEHLGEDRVLGSANTTDQKRWLCYVALQAHAAAGGSSAVSNA